MLSFSSYGISALPTTQPFLDTSTYTIDDLLSKIQKRNQGFYSDKVLYDSVLLSQIEALYEDHIDKKFVVILGIGGSALGGIAIQKMLKPDTEDSLFFLDTLNPEKISEVFQKISLSQTLFVVMSKSGGTVETLSQYAFFLNKVQKSNLEISRHFVFVTGKTGFLRKEGLEKNITIFSVPENVGGRFSVLTAIGLIPARFMGVEISQILKGAQEMQQNFLENNPEKNLPFQFANIQYNALQAGIHKNVMYAYSHFLFPVADWFRQLLAESTGKKISNTGEEVFTGITPINAMGITDHHSQNQLYMEGPFDTLICFLETDSFDSDITVPDLGFSDAPLHYLEGKKFSEILQAEREASKKALTECNRPWVTLHVPEISAEYLGQLFLFFEASTAFLGEMMNINAFDQPGVERTKILTKEILQKKFL